jgi:hypothetical protein
MRLTARKETALRAMRRGQLEYTADGWISSVGYAGIWNTHTITFLAWLGLCALDRAREAATITRQGKDWLEGQDRWAA